MEAGITRPPVNPYLFLRSHRSPGVEGVDLQWFSGLNLDGWSGYSAKHRRLGVFINSSQSYVKKRWTGAHELGHAVLKHKLYCFEEFGTERDPEEERQANIFAEELLIPLSFLRRILATGKIKSIYELMLIFHVSKDALEIALKRHLPPSQVSRVVSAPPIPISFVEFLEKTVTVPVRCPHCGELLYPTKHTLVTVCVCGLELHFASKEFLSALSGPSPAPAP
ncbi:ImmA/IrrE family metallo-endopeptidase [Moorellaceae bacterium AZ2]